MSKEDVESIFREGCRLFYLHSNSDLPKNRVEELFRRVVAIEPDNHKAYNMLGLCYESMDQIDRALEMFRKAIEISPRSVYYLNMGIILANEDDQSGALEAMERAVELDPQDPSAFFNLGHLQYLQGDLEQAISSWKKTGELDPSYQGLHNQLGLALIEAEEMDKAADIFIEGLEKFPNLIEHYANLAYIFEHSGKYDEAAAVWEKFLKTNPHKDEETLRAAREEKARLISKIKEDQR